MVYILSGSAFGSFSFVSSYLLTAHDTGDFTKAGVNVQVLVILI